MRHIANATYMSLDGVVQHPELWTFDYRSDDAARVSHDQLFAADALIMGRHTYDIFVSHWPAATDPNGFADRMNTIPKYVLSRTLSQPSWTNTTVLAGDDVVGRIRALKQEPGQNILQYGYGPVTRLLIDHGLLDELHIWLHPLLVGNTDSRDHIGAVGAASRWQLDDVRRHDSGLVILTYRQPEALARLARAGRERALFHSRMIADICTPDRGCRYPRSCCRRAGHLSRHASPAGTGGGGRSDH